MNIARTNVEERDILRRWWCKKYKLPPTDDRLGAYSEEELFIEFLEDMIADGSLEMLADTSVGIKRTYKGVEIYESGSKLFDEMEREWAEQSVDDIEMDIQAVMEADGDEYIPRQLQRDGMLTDENAEDLLKLIQEEVKNNV